MSAFGSLQNPHNRTNQLEWAQQPKGAPSASWATSSWILTSRNIGRSSLQGGAERGKTDQQLSYPDAITTIVAPILHPTPRDYNDKMDAQWSAERNSARVPPVSAIVWNPSNLPAAPRIVIATRQKEGGPLQRQRTAQRAVRTSTLVPGRALQMLLPEEGPLQMSAPWGAPPIPVLRGAAPPLMPALREAPLPPAPLSRDAPLLPVPAVRGAQPSP